MLKHTVKVLWETCEKCRYGGGFHLALRPVKTKEAAAGKTVQMLLKCPNCGQLYDVGLTADL